ncbi:hypothetical protein [Escherichia phage Henu8]|uniref:Uncharacterized protein n=1 Tax=Escherichia phage Henu8 TaxID=2596677 RepID=A0A5B8RPM5_9CAUD|nr:hypothetical protein H1N90_gp19 [Escherichia phage Henu8]QEA10068.1 hypothetical protein [Escherichia phage Henu8]
MIYIHYYHIGTNENKQERRTICDTLDDAKSQQQVLGGVIQAFEPVEDIEYREHLKEIFVDEISSLIDDMTNHGPGSPWEEAGSTEWDCAKVATLNNFRELLDDF